MTAEEMVKKYKIEMQEDGRIYVTGKPSAAVIAEIKSIRPEIVEYLEKQEAIRIAKQAEREAVWAAKRAEEKAADQPLLDEMNKRVDVLKSQMPANHVLVNVEQTGDLDGDPILKYTVDDIKLSWQDVNHIGWASAVRPGAMGAFESVCVCSIDADKLAEIKSRQLEETRIKAEKRAAREKELTETVIPADALEDYRRYHGNADAAWRAEDEGAWAMIEKWSEYIEAQYGMDHEKLIKLNKEFAREQNYGIKE